jgi:iron complex outermembrane recepter protein
MYKNLFLAIALLASTAIDAQQPEKDSIKTKQLGEITVVGNANKFKVDKSQSVAKLPLRDLENPQVYNSISEVVLKEQVVTELVGALRNATGITRLWESTGRPSDGAEYYSIRGFSLQPTIVNGVASLTNGTLDLANVESIEAIKGPSGTLYGGNLIYYGGLINVNTKKPFDSFGGEIGYITGSYGLNRVAADINTPLSNQASFRLNAAYQYQNTFQDAGFSKSLFISPSFKFKASDDLTFLVNTEYKAGEKANAPMFFLQRSVPVLFTNIDLFENNYKKSYTSNQLTIKNPTFSMQSQALYKISPSWNSQTIVSSSNTKTDGYYQYLWDGYNGSDFYRYISKQNSSTNTIDIQQNFNADLWLGKIRNRVLVGGDYLQKEIVSNNSPWVSHGVVSLSKQTDSGVLTTEAVDSNLAKGGEADVSDATVKIWSGYFSDVVNITRNFSALLGLRIDSYSARASSSVEEVEGQTTFSQKLGVVYQPLLDKVSLFANYMNGFQNLDPVLVYDSNNNVTGSQILKPEKANQLEIGVKTNVYKDKISFTASYYDIRVKDKAMSASDQINNTVQGGKVRSKGVEFSLIASPFNGMNLIAGYSYNDNKVTKDAANSNYLGLRTEESGPANLFNFWASYKADKGALKGFTLGFGGNSASKYNTLNRISTNQFTLPGYTILNGLVSYSGDKYILSLKADNLTNKKYFGGWSTVTPQKLRTISLAMNYKF